MRLQQCKNKIKSVIENVENMKLLSTFEDYLNHKIKYLIYLNVYNCSDWLQIGIEKGDQPFLDYRTTCDLTTCDLP